MTKKTATIRHELTPYGFHFGAATVTRMASDEKKGWVMLDVKTPKETIEMAITKSGIIHLTRR